MWDLGGEGLGDLDPFLDAGAANFGDEKEDGGGDEGAGADDEKKEEEASEGGSEAFEGAIVGWVVGGEVFGREDFLTSLGDEVTSLWGEGGDSVAVGVGEDLDLVFGAEF